MLQSPELIQFSSDMFKSWTRCPKQFYYKYVQRLQWPTDIRHFRLGRDVHKLLDYQARRLDCDLLLESAPQDVRWIWTKLMRHPSAHWPVLANEWAFHVPVEIQPGETQWLTGRIDRIARDNDMLVVIDWKTGTGVPRLPEADWQTVLYRYAVVEVAQSPSASDLGFNFSGPLQPEQVRFEYIEIKPDAETPVRTVTLPYDTEQHVAARERIGQVLGQMAAEATYPLPDICPDRFCPYASICGIQSKN